MKIEKAKLSKALKQIGMFIGKNNTVDRSVTRVHFKNENKRAMIFASDLASSGRTYFDTDEVEPFEFCIEYVNLLQTVRARGSELTATIYKGRKNENGEDEDGIEFTDGKTKFDWALFDVNSLALQESASVIPTNVPYYEIDAKTLKNAIKEVGYARREGDEQAPYLAGTNFIGCGEDLTLVSSDRFRVACWKRTNTTQAFEGMEPKEVSGILSAKAIASIGLYDDDDTIKVYLADSKVVLVSDRLEAYVAKIMCPYPNLMKMFECEKVATYKLSAKALKESLEIILDKDEIIKLDFNKDSVTVSTMCKSGNGAREDTFPCECIDGGAQSITVGPNNILDIVKNSIEDEMTIDFLGITKNEKFSTVFSYSFGDGAFGMLAPKVIQSRG